MPYPYTVTVPGLVGAIRQLRSVFPGQVNAATLKKWGIAPNNETYVVHVLRFLGIIDQDGNKQTEAAKVFVEHDDAEFAKKFSGLVRKAYSGLFEYFGEGAWTLDKDRLISFFRAEDDTSATVGARQANTFLTLAQLSGYGPPPAEPKSAPIRRSKPSPSPNPKRGRSRDAVKAVPPSSTPNVPVGLDGQAPSGRPIANGSLSGLNLTVRIEINLPVTDEQGIYDKIFKSIRANLIDA